MARAIYDLSTDGHRESYFQTFERIWGANRVVGPENFNQTKNFDHVVFISADDYFFLYFFEAISRSLRGKRTDGLLLRAENLALQSWTPKRFLKGLLLKILKRVPRVRTIGIVPFEILPDLRKYLTDAIYDLQFWDLRELHPKLHLSPHAVEVFREIKIKANGRKIVMALGRQEESKGILFFFALWNNPEIREHFYFVVIGQNKSVDPRAFESFENEQGFVWNDRVSDDDLIASYRQADLIWCCYHPTYNVSSGIYGRSLQLQKFSLIRKDSLLAIYDNRFKTSLQLPYGEVAPTVKLLLAAPSAVPQINSELFRKNFDRVFPN